MVELTVIQREILSALINLFREKGRAIKGEEISERIDRNPGTVRNQMQSLKALAGRGRAGAEEAATRRRARPTRL
jgi:predicted transcriptional regulator